MEEPGSKSSGEPLVVAVALNGGGKSKYIIKWALDKFLPEGDVSFKIIHIYPKITGVPTPMGNLIPLPQVRDDVANAYRKEVEWQKTEALLPHQRLCSAKKVHTEILLVESDEVPNTISMELAKGTMKHLVIGASSTGLFSRKVKGQLLSSLISESAPGFCTVYVVCKGKLESLRPSEAESNGRISADTGASSDSTDHSSRYSSSTLDPGSSSSESTFNSPLPSQITKRIEPLPSVKPSFSEAMRETTDVPRWKSVDLRDEEDALNFVAGNSDSLIRATSTRSYTGGTPLSYSSQSTMNSPPPSNSRLTGDVGRWGSSDQILPSSFSSGHGQSGVSIELERLRMELRHIRGMYSIAQHETIDATRQLTDLSKLRLEEAIKLKEINDKEERAKEQARQEKERTHAAIKEAEHARECAIQESYQRREAERIAAREAKEREKLKHVVSGPTRQYQKFSWDEIAAATDNFSQDLKIGIGSYGTVYRCKLHHTTVAIKVLHSKEGSQNKQFQQELEILSRIRHPHLLLLLGACPDEGCLVYEFMENGSLEDRLFRKDNTAPLTWYDRFRIAWEVASALAFLHNTKPRSIIHRDLKPANILLDQHLVSKIGDAGLCTMLNLDPSTMTMAGRTIYKDTCPVGTLCYIDPEYQRTGLISTKSDVYALGMVILQLLTAKPAVGIAHVVEGAINEGRLMQILDGDAGKWPVRETTELALLGLQCAELRRKDRPDLKENILPALEKAKEIAEEARDVVANGPIAPPSHFICPILKDVMEDPCVAADGYTYDRKAIEMWLKENDTSPTTNFPLSSTNLIANNSLQYAIMEWKSRRKSPRGSLKSK